jgi:molecular chaperone DnaK (HSP70)
MSRHVIGISVGSQNTVVGVLKGSVVDIILSETSSRCVPTLTAFNDRERSFGDAAFSTIKSNYLRTISYPNRYLGLKSDSPFLEEEKKYETALSSVDQNGKVIFEVNYKGEKEIVYPENAMGIYFNKLKQNWMKAGYETKDVVVSVPDYYTVAERKAMIDAINIADLNCTALINESSSVALAYGWFKRTTFEEKPRIVAFVDMGQSKTTISYVSFTKTTQKVVSVTTERNCGAREFDMNLAKFFSDVFKKKHGLEPIKSVKIKLRMMDAISKTRKILTVNKEAALSVESLMDDEDLHHILTREEFEKIISPTVENFKNVIKNSLVNLEKDAKLTLQDLHSIEMVGDAVRTPCIQEAIRETFGMDLGKSLMPDECMARGSTLFAAMNSPYFTFKDFNIEHFNYYSIFIEYPFLSKFISFSFSYFNFSFAFFFFLFILIIFNF